MNVFRIHPLLGRNVIGIVLNIMSRYVVASGPSSWALISHRQLLLGLSEPKFSMSEPALIILSFPRSHAPHITKLTSIRTRPLKLIPNISPLPLPIHHQVLSALSPQFYLNSIPSAMAVVQTPAAVAWTAACTSSPVSASSPPSPSPVHPLPCCLSHKPKNQIWSCHSLVETRAN